MAGHQLVHGHHGLAPGHSDEAQGHGAQVEADQAPPEGGHVVVLPLGDGHRQHPRLPAVEADALVEPTHLLALRLGVRQEDLRRARLQDEVAPHRTDHVCQALTDEDHGRILLAERPEPLLELLPEQGVQGRDPGLLDDQERRALVPEPLLDPVEQVEQHGDEILLPQRHQVAHLEDLEAARAQAVDRRVQETAQAARQGVVVQGRPGARDPGACSRDRSASGTDSPRGAPGPGGAPCAAPGWRGRPEGPGAISSHSWAQSRSISASTPASGANPSAWSASPRRS